MSAVERIIDTRDQWPDAVSDGLTLPCRDCGEVPRFDYHVADDFWRQWVPGKPDRLGVVCLPCLDRRCGGVGLAEALEGVHWTGTGHTVVLVPEMRLVYDKLGSPPRARGGRDGVATTAGYSRRALR